MICDCIPFVIIIPFPLSTTFPSPPQGSTFLLPIWKYQTSGRESQLCNLRPSRIAWMWGISWDWYVFLFQKEAENAKLGFWKLGSGWCERAERWTVCGRLALFLSSIAMKVKPYLIQTHASRLVIVCIVIHLLHWRRMVLYFPLLPPAPPAPSYPSSIAFLLPPFPPLSFCLLFVIGQGALWKAGRSRWLD